MTLTVTSVSKRFGRFAALNDVSLEAREGEFLALLGPSGSGKTTLLRVLAGLEAPESGRVAFDGEDFLAQTARERRVGMVFQNYALFRHMTVAQNIGFGLSVRPRRVRPSSREIATRVRGLLELVQLEGLGGRYPSQLSGGQRQRVALARALAVDPKVLLLDEPFGALDAKVRDELRSQLRRIHDATQVTTVFVTHDQDEAMDLADRVVVMNRGRVEQIGRPADLEERPGSQFVFEFLGDCNRLPCRVEGGAARFDGFSATVIGGAGPGGGSGSAVALFRPYDTAVEMDAAAPGVAAELMACSRRGAVLTYEFRTSSGDAVTAELVRAGGEPLPIGAPVKLRPRRVYLS